MAAVDSRFVSIHDFDYLLSELEKVMIKDLALITLGYAIKDKEWVGLSPSRKKFADSYILRHNCDDENCPEHNLMLYHRSGQNTKIPLFKRRFSHKGKTVGKLFASVTPYVHEGEFILCIDTISADGSFFSSVSDRFIFTPDNLNRKEQEDTKKFLIKWCPKPRPKPEEIVSSVVDENGNEI
jgi:hypothetical protein